MAVPTQEQIDQTRRELAIAKQLEQFFSGLAVGFLCTGVLGAAVTAGISPRDADGEIAPIVTVSASIIAAISFGFAGWFLKEAIFYAKRGAR